MLFENLLNIEQTNKEDKNDKPFHKATLSVDQKAIQKYPFTLNNQTYFASECFYADTLINGVCLNLKSAKGISNEQQEVDYLNFSHRLVFYAGSNILVYSRNRKSYEAISSCNNLVALKALSLSTQQKQFIFWVQKRIRSLLGGPSKYFYHICLYDMTKKDKIVDEKLLTCPDLSPKSTQLIVFMHPIKLIGIICNNFQEQTCEITYRKQAKHAQNKAKNEQFEDECKMQLPYLIQKIKYDLESNSYLFINKNNEICHLRLYSSFIEKQDYENEEQINLVAEVLIGNEKKPIVFMGNRVRKQLLVGDNYLAVLVEEQNNYLVQQEQGEELEGYGNDYYIQFYSIFTYQLIFKAPLKNNVSLPSSVFKAEQQNQEASTIQSKSFKIKSFQFNKNIITVFREKGTIVSIYIIFEQKLRHVRDLALDMSNCLQILKMFINPYSSEVLTLSRHYQLEGTLTAAQKSKKIIIQTQTRYKSFFLEMSSFFITAQSSTMNVDKLDLGKKNYHQILIAPWRGDYVIQCENGILGKNFEEKFDNSVKCSSFHPTGIYIALGFNDCFKIYYVNHQSLEPTYITQSVKECSSLAYSTNGDQLAVATTHMILIYDSYSYIRKYQLSIGVIYRVQEVFFSQFTLHCITQSKRIIAYNKAQQYQQSFSFNPRGHIENGILQSIFSLVKDKNNGTSNSNQNNPKKVNSIIYDEKTNVVIFSSNSKIHFVSGISYESIGAFQFQDITTMELCHSISTLFLGTASGKIICYPWPNKPININSKIPTYNVHSSRVKKIKMTSDMFFLISIAEDSLYIHSMSVVKEMRKIQKYELQRQLNPQSILALDFLIRQGLCLSSTFQYHQKLQHIKQNQEEAVNLNFILPEEREKQKKIMLRQLSQDQEQMAFLNQEQSLPFKIQTIKKKQQVKCLQNKLRELKKGFQMQKDKQLMQYSIKMSQLAKEKDELNQKHKQMVLNMEKNTKQQSDYLRKQMKRAEMGYYIKIEDLERNTQQIAHKKEISQRNFYQLPEIDQEKQIYNQQIIHKIIEDIEKIGQRNGYLMCRNSNVQKQIKTKRRKIQELKDLIYSIKKNIAALPKKKTSEIPVCEKDQLTVMKQFQQTEKKYLKETKKLIDKNKAVNVSISVYQKEKELLVMLEKQLQEEEHNIDQIIEYLQKERTSKKSTGQKVVGLHKKAQEIIKSHAKIIEKRTRSRYQLKNFIHNICLYLQGVISLSQIKKIAKIKVCDMVQAPQNYQICIDEKKKRIDKILSSQDKIMNVMRNDRKIFSNEKKKSSVQNQDLLVNFNFLNHQNKLLANVLKNQHEKKRTMLKNMPSTRRLNTKVYPQKLKQNSSIIRSVRRMKTSPCQQFDL